MSNIRWLIALEAALFFSVVCWDTTASWAAPTYEPVPFTIALAGAATLGLLTCHIGPAFYASRFPVPAWVMAWLAFGYLEWLWGMGEACSEILGVPRAICYAVPAILVWRQSAWRTAVAVLLTGSAGILGWCLQTQWRGIWATNPHYSSGQTTLLAHFTPGVLLAAAPAIVIAWRIGTERPRAGIIWWSGILGVWIPAVLAITVASVAADAGATLHWRPSLFRGFYWALQGAQRLNETAVAVAYCTMLAPAVLSLYSLRELNAAWTGRRLMLFVPLGLWAILWGLSQWTGPGDGLEFFFFTAPHRWWAWGIIALGAAAGLRVLFLPASGKMQYHRADNV